MSDKPDQKLTDDQLAEAYNLDVNAPDLPYVVSVVEATANTMALMMTFSSVQRKDLVKWMDLAGDLSSVRPAPKQAHAIIVAAINESLDKFNDLVAAVNQISQQQLLGRG